MGNPYAVLIVDDEVKLCRNISFKLKKNGFLTYEAHDGRTALELIQSQKIDLVILDYMLSDMTGLEVLKQIKSQDANLAVLMLTAYGNIENAVLAMKLGAEDFLNKPIELSLLLEVVKKACAQRQTRIENQLLKEEFRHHQSDLIVQSPKMNSIMNLLQKVVHTDASILLLGETGVGKTAIAKWIHKQSDRKDKPFVSINCTSIPETLLESELFGYQKGAFTGAVDSRPGKFEAADQGTIFLDEIGEISLSMQAKLLQVIEEKRFMRLGSHIPRKVDVRILSATNQSLKQLVQEHKFREDLYYRLNLIEIEIPPLRERKEDISLIAEEKIQQLNQKYRKNLILSTAASERLTQYPWPGNIRELLNVLERMHLLKQSGEIEVSDLPKELVENGVQIRDGQLRNALDEVEAQLIIQAMEQTGGNQTKAAQRLGISRNSLIYKLKKIDYSGE